MKLHPNTIQAYKLFHDGVLAFGRAEQQGIRIDLSYCENERNRLTEEINQLAAQFKKTKFFRNWEYTTKGAVNIDSNFQLSTFLYKVKKIKLVRQTKSGQGSTDEETLTGLGIPELDDLLRIRKLKKVRDTYIEGFIREQVNGVIHPFFSLHLARSYRSSGQSPNFQNIPKRDAEVMKMVRSAFLPRPGHQLMEVDYGAIEVRIAACYHKDPTMLKYIIDKHDMHGDMAQQIFKLKYDKSIPVHKELRAAVKNGFVFPQFYGDYYKNNAISIAVQWGKLPEGRWKTGQGLEMPNGNLSDHLISKGITSINKFINHIKDIEADFWANRFPKYRVWKERWWRKYQKDGYVDMLTGFRCVDLLRKNEAINRPIQGSAFHCLLWAFIELDKIMVRDKWQTRLIGQIHDAIVFDVYPPEREMVLETVQQIMCEDIRKAWPWIIVPLEVESVIGEIDASWATL